MTFMLLLFCWTLVLLTILHRSNAGASSPSSPPFIVMENKLRIQRNFVSTEGVSQLFDNLKEFSVPHPQDAIDHGLIDIKGHAGVAYEFSQVQDKIRAFRDIVYDNAQGQISGILRLQKVKDPAARQHVKSLVNRTVENRVIEDGGTIHLYLSRPESSALANHTDITDIFVLQLAGAKEWILCDANAPQLAHEIDRNLRGKLDLCTTYSSIEMESLKCERATLYPGDALYLPKHVVHSAQAAPDGLSAHLTFGFADNTCSSSELNSCVAPQPIFQHRELQTTQVTCNSDQGGTQCSTSCDCSCTGGCDDQPCYAGCDDGCTESCDGFLSSCDSNCISGCDLSCKGGCDTNCNDCCNGGCIVCPTPNPTPPPTKPPTPPPTPLPTPPPTKPPTPGPTLEPAPGPTPVPTPPPTPLPTPPPTPGPTPTPSDSPTQKPSIQPSVDPTAGPSQEPSIEVSLGPTDTPSAPPTNVPSVSPSLLPSKTPTEPPSVRPSNSPSHGPSAIPSSQPSLGPTIQPSADPTFAPVIGPTPPPTPRPTPVPTIAGSAWPSILPSQGPTGTPSIQRSDKPSTTPFVGQTPDPTALDSASPSRSPTDVPTLQPVLGATNGPTVEFSSQPSTKPYLVPSFIPSALPSLEPTDAILTTIISEAGFNSSLIYGLVGAAAALFGLCFLYIFFIRKNQKKHILKITTEVKPQDDGTIKVKKKTVYRGNYPSVIEQLDFPNEATANANGYFVDGRVDRIPNISSTRNSPVSREQAPPNMEAEYDLNGGGGGDIPLVAEYVSDNDDGQTPRNTASAGNDNDDEMLMGMKKRKDTIGGKVVGHMSAQDEKNAIRQERAERGRGNHSDENIKKSARKQKDGAVRDRDRHAKRAARSSIAAITPGAYSSSQEDKSTSKSLSKSNQPPRSLMRQSARDREKVVRKYVLREGEGTDDGATRKAREHDAATAGRKSRARSNDSVAEDRAARKARAHDAETAARRSRARSASTESLGEDQTATQAREHDEENSARKSRARSKDGDAKTGERRRRATMAHSVSDRRTNSLSHENLLTKGEHRKPASHRKDSRSSTSDGSLSHKSDRRRSSKSPESDSPHRSSSRLSHVASSDRSTSKGKSHRNSTRRSERSPKRSEDAKMANQSTPIVEEIEELIAL